MVDLARTSYASESVVSSRRLGCAAHLSHPSRMAEATVVRSVRMCGPYLWTGAHASSDGAVR